MSALVDHRADTAGDEPEGSGDPGAAPAVTELVDLHKRRRPAPRPRPHVDAVGDVGDVGAPVEPDTRFADDPGEWSAPQIVQDAPELAPERLRVDFGLHLEANYQRLVAQLYAITLDAGEAHDVVQDAYSRAWRRWAELSGSDDPTGWVRRVAVRSTQRSWRRAFSRLGLFRPVPVGQGVDPRTDALLAALQRLPAPERRAVVLFHMVGMSHGEIAELEQVSLPAVRERLRRGNHVVTGGMADVLPSVLGAMTAGPDPIGRHDERQY